MDAMFYLGKIQKISMKIGGGSSTAAEYRSGQNAKKYMECIEEGSNHVEGMEDLRTHLWIVQVESRRESRKRRRSKVPTMLQVVLIRGNLPRPRQLQISEKRHPLAFNSKS